MAMSEDQLLAECIQWAWNYVPETRRLIWHIANERAASPVEGAQLKAKGVVTGACDVVFFWKNTPYVFEFKLPNRMLRNHQKKVIDALRNQGIYVEVIRSWVQWENEIRRIINK